MVLTVCVDDVVLTSIYGKLNISGNRLSFIKLLVMLIPSQPAVFNSKRKKLMFEKETDKLFHKNMMFARNHLESIKICAAEMIKPFLQNLQERKAN